MRRGFLIVVSIISLLVPFILKAQGTYPTTQQIAQFAESKLLVVANSSDVAFNARLRKAVQEHWNITEFKFVEGKEFEAESTNPEFSFLTTASVQFDRDPDANSYQFMYILLPHPTGDITEMPVIAQVPFQSSPVESSNHLHKTGMLIKFLQKHAEDVINSKGHKKYRKLKFLNRNIKELKGKTFVFAESQIDSSLRDEELFDKVYKNDWRMVSDDELVKVISEAKENDVVIHTVASNDDAEAGKCFKMIIEPSSGKAYFYKSHKINEKRPPVFLKRDFRKIRWYPFHWL
ncbi:MAG: hypothetical protein ACLFNU_03505 [Bacteroidales bacterium]